MKKKIFSGIVIAAVAIWVHACYYDKYEKIYPTVGLFTPCDSAAVQSYSNNIAPILQTSCGSKNSCHNTADGTNNFVDLSNYAGVSNVAATGQLVGAVTWDPNYHSMPKNSTSKISDCNIRQIQKWVDAGYPDN